MKNSYLKIATAGLALAVTTGLASAATNIVSPNVLPIAVGCVGGKAINANANPLQAAIDAAAPGDTLILLPGDYYIECNVVVDKPLTILGAAAGIPADPTGAFRITGESYIHADPAVAPNGLHGINIFSSGVTVDGLYFKGVHYRNAIGVVTLTGGAFAGAFQDISVLNNYVEVNYTGSGPWATHLNGTIDNLLVSGNALRMAQGFYSTIGFRANFGGLTLNGLTITDNTIESLGAAGKVLQFLNNTVSPDSVICGNSFVNVPAGTCAINSANLVVAGDTNVGLVPGDCPNILIASCPTGGGGDDDDDDGDDDDDDGDDDDDDE